MLLALSFNRWILVNSGLGFIFPILCFDLPLFCFLEHALLVLLLPQSVQEFVWLREHLRNESVLVKVLHVKYLSRRLVIPRGNLVDLLEQILVF